MYTDYQREYITAHGGVIDDAGYITISYKAFRIPCKAGTMKEYRIRMALYMLLIVGLIYFCFCIVR